MKGTVWGIYDAAEPGLLTFLSAFNDVDEAAALDAVVGAVCCEPRLFDHAYVVVLREFLRSNPFLSEETRNRWFVSILKAYIEHVLIGSHRVEITNVGQPVGRPMLLFHKIKEVDGSFPSEANRRQTAAAWDFVESFEEMHQSLDLYQPAEQDGNTIDWQGMRADYERESTRRSTVEVLAHDLRRFFEQFISNRQLQPTAEPDYERIATDGLNEAVKGNSIRHEISCALMASLPLTIFPKSPLKIDSGSIHKTLETLRGKDYLGPDAFQVIRHGVSVRLRLLNAKPPRLSPAESLRFYSPTPP